MQRTFPFVPSARLATTAVTAGLLALTLSACSDGGSKPKAQHNRTTTSSQPHRSTTTSTTLDGTGTSSTLATSTTTGPGATSTTTGTRPGGCGAASGPITAAVLSGDLGPVPVASYTVTDCRLSATQPIWAAVTLAPRPGQTVPQLTVAMNRIGALWTVHSYGQGPTGCDAPAPVPTELRLGC